MPSPRQPGTGQPVVFPSGTAELAKRVIAGEHDVAVELCRRLDGSWSFTGMVKAFFAGKLSTPIFDCLADSYDQVRHERDLDGLNSQLTERSPV